VGIAHVLEERGDVAAEDAGVVGDDQRARRELRLELAQVVEVVLLGGIDEHEVEAAGQERHHAERVADDDLDAVVEPGGLRIELHELREVGIRLDARETAARRHRARDQDGRVAEERADLDPARRAVAVEQAPDHAALGAPDVRDVPQRRGAVHHGEHAPRLLVHCNGGREAGVDRGWPE